MGDGNETDVALEKPSGSYHHGDLRRALIDAAIAQIDKGGTGAVSLRGVARLVGVSQTAPYRHFKDKRALLAAVAEQGFLTLAELETEAAQRLAHDPVARLREMGMIYVRFAEERPAHFRVMFGPDFVDRRPYPGLDVAGQQAFAPIAEAVEACHEAGHFGDAPANEVGFTAWALVHGVANLVVDRQLRPFGLSDATGSELASMATERLFKGLFYKST